MNAQEHVFKRRYDFFYITLLVYVAFFVLYILITGTVTDETVKFGFRDPVVYIIGIFILHALVMLLINVVRNRRLVLTDDRMIFRSRFGERSIPFSDIERIRLSREKRKPNDGTFAVLKLHVADRRRVLRIRVANYEHEQELYEMLKKLEEKVGAVNPSS